MNDVKQPLVSIIIPNRNHSNYIRSAIESALAQTYKNIEIIVSDNCSSDDSIEVVMKYLDKGVMLNKNPVNIFNYNYRILAKMAKGKYFLMLCADDLIMPTFVEKAVAVMEKHPNVGCVHCERDYIDEHGEILELDPFFNCSFTVDGESMLPIFMLTDIGQAAQGMIRRTAFDECNGHDTETDHSNIDRELWFRLAMVSDYAYICENLTHIRIHSGSETSKAAKYFVHPLSLYVMIKGFCEWAELKGYDAVKEREPKAMAKLAAEVMDITVGLICGNENSAAQQYLLFAEILDKGITKTRKYQDCIKALEEENTSLLNEYRRSDNRLSFHKRSYDPPENYIALEESK